MKQLLYLIALCVVFSVGAADAVSAPDPAVAEKYPSQKQLIYKGWNKTDYELEIKDDSVRVIGKSPLCSGVTTKNFKLTPGAVYQVVFEARGNASILCMASGNGVKRLDLCGATKLTDQWKKFDLQFTAPETAVTSAIFLYAWQQPGCEFEVRNFQVSPR